MRYFLELFNKNFTSYFQLTLSQVTSSHFELYHRSNQSPGNVMSLSQAIMIQVLRALFSFFFFFFFLLLFMQRKRDAKNCCAAPATITRERGAKLVQCCHWMNVQVCCSSVQLTARVSLQGERFFFLFSFHISPSLLLLLFLSRCRHLNWWGRKKKSETSSHLRTLPFSCGISIVICLSFPRYRQEKVTLSSVAFVYSACAQFAWVNGLCLIIGHLKNGLHQMCPVWVASF